MYKCSLPGWNNSVKALSKMSVAYSSKLLENDFIAWYIDCSLVLLDYLSDVFPTKALLERKSRLCSVQVPSFFLKCRPIIVIMSASLV